MYLRVILALLAASRDHKIPSLDGLRGVSIALVLFSHCAGTRHAYSSHVLDYTGDIGVLGVKVFFVISGFIITTILLDEHARTGTISLKNFYFRRVLRIFPAFYTFLLVSGLLTLAGVLRIPGRDFVHAATFTANLFSIRWDLLHIWSLSVEEQFYLLWPAALVLFGLRRPLRVVSILILLPSLYFGYVLHSHQRVSEAISGLAAGCVLAAFRHSLHTHEGYLRVLRSRWTAPILVAMIFVLESLYRYEPYALVIPLISVLIAMMLDSVSTFSHGFIGRALNSKAMVYLGLLSYSIYLWQQVFLNRWEQNWFNAFPANLVCVFACALTSFYLIERPFLRLKSRARRTPVLPQTVPESQAQIA